VGSIEYAVAVLDVPLIVVLGHDECGAVRAAIDSTDAESPELPPHIWRLIAPIVPAVRRVQRANGTPGALDSEEVGREHLRDTVEELMHSSELISAAVADGRLAIVGANYRLGDGTAVPHIVRGPVDIEAD
jgi:carbonic anhydrase